MTNPWDPDIDFDESVARRLLAAQFPEYAGAKWVPFGGGWDNRLFLIDDEWVLRFPVRHIAGTLMAQELAALPYLESRLPLPIPNPVIAGVPDDDYPFQWMGYRLLEGEVLSRIEPPPTSVELARQLGTFLRELHAIDPEAVTTYPDVHDKANLGARFDQIEDRLQLLIEDGVVGDAIGRGLIEMARDLSTAEAWPNELPIVHGDLYGNHILSDGATATGIIDWGDIHRGDPALDLSIGYAWFDGEARQALFDAYGELDEATQARARFRSIFYVPILIQYGREIGDAATEKSGWRALELAG